ncbi:MAG TPA: nuclear transport factor 2 family protein [Pyrinomonadaceae bacterium]|nr:nuclear transport factor 2 family protein [Pyrinomonadaceae bacterium]
MSRLFLLISLIAVAGVFSCFAQADADRDAIKRAALNYAEGWYEGNADKMESSLHPDLAKRIVRTNDKGQSALSPLSALGLVQGTRSGYGKNTPAAEQQKDVTILDVFGGAATVKLEMRDWIDYMHVGKFNGKWVIINVLWEMKPKKETK